jgi:hypothetical protein
MVGKHHIIIETSKLKYSFHIRRNITIIQGESATGKTTLIELLADYKRRGPGQGINVSSDIPVYVYTGEDKNWKYELDNVKRSLVFVDEDYSFIYTKEFAVYLAASDNYYVFITRKPLYALPYSTQEIYGIRTSGKFHFPEQVYHEFYPIYPVRQAVTDNKKLMILVEDKEAGYQFYKNVAGEERCISAEGNSKIYSKMIETDSSDGVLIIADGAALGPFVDKLVKYATIKQNVALFFPESFEWMILKSGILHNALIDEILAKPEDYIDNTRYISWERFFTALLQDITSADPIKQYSKSSLPSFYTGENAKSILHVMPEEIRRLI